MTNINIKINNTSAEKVSQEGKLTTGMVGATVTFEFGSEWDRFKKAAVFRGGGVTKSKFDIDHVVRIPVEVLQKEGCLDIGVEGYDEDDVLVYPTVWARGAWIYTGANASGDPAADPTLPIWAQLQTMIGDLSALDTNTKNNLVAAINELAAKSGGTVDDADIAELVERYLATNPLEESDPTVPDWAKQPKKPSYTADEVGALPQSTPIPATAHDIGAIPAPPTAEVGQIIRVKSVDEDGKPVEWECVDATNKDAKPFASVILTGKTYQILSYVDGVVDLGVPGLQPPSSSAVALRKKDYSSYVMCRITETSTPGQYSFANLDNAAYKPTIDNIDDYVIEIPDAASISVTGVEKFSHLKCRLTTPRCAVHGHRALITWNGYAPSGLDLGADYINYGNSSLEYTWETKPSDFDGKVWLYSSLRTGKWNYSTINQFRLVDTPTPKNYIRAGHFSELLTVGTKLEVWGE